MKVLLIDNESTLLEKLKKLIPGSEIIKKWNDLSDEENENYDFLILSGSTHSAVWEEKEFLNEMRLIRKASAPIIGICFGCELIARSFGGTLKELTEKEKGITTMRVTIPDPIFSQRMSFDAYMNHRWAIDTIPDGFTVLAESPCGPAVIQHKTLPIIGLQFHPEHLSDKTFGDEIFFNVLEKFRQVVKN